MRLNRLASTFNESRPLKIFSRILGEINIQNFHRLFLILTKENSVEELRLALRRAAKNINSSKHLWKPAFYIQDEAVELNSSTNFLALTAHLFYEDYIELLVELVRKNPIISKVFVTTTTNSMSQQLRAALGDLSVEHDVRVTENRGRNFGPLFTQFPKEILEYKYFIHLHSKKSKHTRKATAIDWSGRFWRQFGLDESLLNRTLAILETHPNLAISYPLVADIIPSVSFAMHSNAKTCNEILSKLGLRFEGERFAFPAGGMFLAKTQSLQELLQMDWRIEDFPPELSQMDGTTQHALERLVGLVPSLRGFGHLIFDTEEDSFTLDESFVEDASLSRKTTSNE